MRGTYEITGNEVLVVEFTVLGAVREDGEILCQRDQAAEEESDDGSPHAERSSVCELIVGNTLCPSRTHKPNVRNK